MRLPLSLLAALTVCACHSVPQSNLPEPVTMQSAETTQTVSGSFPMLYTPPATTSPVPICERFASSLSAAEQKLNTINGGYQTYQLYTP